VAANNLVCIYAARGEQIDLALQLARNAHSVMPNDPEVRDTLGWVYSLQRQWKNALPLLQQNVKKFPKNPTFQYRLGVAQKGAGDLRPARRSLEMALNLKPESPQAEDAKRVLSSR
jgi:Flp pilus assembly protein TadD